MSPQLSLNRLHVCPLFSWSSQANDHAKGTSASAVNVCWVADTASMRMPSSWEYMQPQRCVKFATWINIRGLCPVSSIALLSSLQRYCSLFLHLQHCLMPSLYLETPLSMQATMTTLWPFPRSMLHHTVLILRFLVANQPEGSRMGGPLQILGNVRVWWETVNLSIHDITFSGTALSGEALRKNVVEHENYNKMNARNIAMVFAPNMTQVSRNASYFYLQISTNAYTNVVCFSSRWPIR